MLQANKSDRSTTGNVISKKLSYFFEIRSLAPASKLYLIEMHTHTAAGTIKALKCA